MRFKGLDLNLLVALDVLIEERSVSRAAERMHISQPAMSAALGRLRDYFDDPLLGAHGKRMIPTAHALLLRPMLRELLTGAEAMMSVSTSFDPATSRRHFRIAGSDYAVTVLFGRLIAELRCEAPFLTFDLEPPTERLRARLDQGEIDIVVTPEDYCAPDHPAELLMDEPYVVVGWTGNPLFERPMTEEDFFAAGHVAVEIGSLNRSSFAEAHLRPFGERRRVEVLVSSFLLAPEMVIATDRLTVMQRRLAELFADRLPIRFVAMPMPFPAMREMIQYNRTRAADAGLRWLVDRIKAAVPA